MPSSACAVAMLEELMRAARRRCWSVGLVISGVEVPATGRTVTTGVGLKESELALIDQIVDKSDREIARNAVLRYAVRYFLKAYLSGQVDPLKDVETPKPKKKLRMP